MTPLGPHSRPGKLALIDGRTAEARRLKTIREELAQHLGGKASIVQRMMIERVSILLLRMELMDRKALSEGSLGERDSREYLGWNNAASRMLRTLGLHGAPMPAPDINGYLASRPAEPELDEAA